ncbi:MAG TPA: hypothetical protein VNG12_12250 [Acidimicrobiales bacterium]|nr:hypothetical protein [Acidimicrobiales bacterium]
MRAAPCHRIGSVVAAIGVSSAVAAAGLLIAPLAGAAAGSTVQIANNTAVTLASGWKVSQTKSAQVFLVHRSPNAEVVVLAFGPGTGTVQANATAIFNNFAKGFGLKHIKTGTPDVSQLQGSYRFDQLDSFTYTGKVGSKTLGGLAVEYQSSTAHDGAFAIVIAAPKDKSKLKAGIQQMFTSIATNT